ncbi:MAG: hypothetical protein U9R74_10645, partial [Pseudomonadota bacterium]|nr:hypothetical protein [Pseudomonadota bacterium]
CLFVRLRRCGNGCIERLCARYRALKTNDNPAQSGMSFSGNRLTTGLDFCLRFTTTAHPVSAAHGACIDLDAGRALETLKSGSRPVLGRRRVLQLSI